MNPIRLLLAAATCVSSAYAFTSTVHVNRVSSQLHNSEVLGLSEGNYKKVFVAGGSKGVGRLVVDKLIADGVEVVTLVRSDEAVDELSAVEGVTAIKGDAMDYKSVEDALYGCDSVITTLGGGSHAREDGKWVDYTGNNNGIGAAGILGVTR